MGKRLVNMNDRADQIVSYMQKERSASVSAYTSQAVIDETLPVYSRLKVEALYLLDFARDGAKDWNGKLIIATGEDELQYHCKETLGRGVEWLKDHHIKNADVLREVINHYKQNTMSGGVSDEHLNEYVKENMKKVQKKLSDIDTSYSDTDVCFGLGYLGTKVVDNWSKLWDWIPAYELLCSVVYLENPIGDLDPMWVISCLQHMENQFIAEAIGEKSE